MVSEGSDTKSSRSSRYAAAHSATVRPGRNASDRFGITPEDGRDEGEALRPAYGSREKKRGTVVGAGVDGNDAENLTVSSIEALPCEGE